MNPQKRFKGGKFQNRYKIVGTLITQSSLHIGDGQRKSDQNRVPAPEQNAALPEFDTVATDLNERAYIPGSTLKGNLRAWLAQIFSAPPFESMKIATTNSPQRATALRGLQESNGAKDRIHNELHLVEYLFGSAVNEGKLEFWDSPMAQPPTLPKGKTPQAYCGYDPQRGTIVLKSVAIDPASGTAAKNLLFNYEVVPPGAQFRITIAGQNLAPVELGMLLFALEGFQSQIYPVTLGAMAGIGFGRMQFKLQSVFKLDPSNVTTWLESAVESGHAGYAGLAQLSDEERDSAVLTFRNAFMEAVKAEG